MKKQTNKTSQPTKIYNLVISYLCSCCAKKLNDEQKAKRINIPGLKGNYSFMLNLLVAVKANGSSADFYVLQPHSEKKLKIVTASFPLKYFALNYLHPGMVRVHDSWMINLNYLYAVYKNGNLGVHYLEDTTISIGTKYKTSALEEMKKRGFMVYE
ncbi:MAG: hypothetical protein AB7P01_04580 [Bacteroidia bacterium]